MSHGVVSYIMSYLESDLIFDLLFHMEYHKRYHWPSSKMVYIVTMSIYSYINAHL